jgi:predicted metalloprotease with PDZ domain
MRRISGDTWDFGDFEADDYDDLVDHPFEAGALDVLSFAVEGVPHHLVLSGRHQADLARLERDLPPICAEHARMFGGLPIDRYVFISMIVGEGYGGLEHRFSTALLSSRDDLPRAGEPGLSDGYKTYLHLCSHEYFHLWNVKRIRPARLTPYDYQNENYTTLLWAFEGITSYYDNLACTRAGVFAQDDFLGLLGETATRVLRGPGRLAQSLSDSSFDAWTKFYRPTENTSNQVVSYYAKGSLAALALDLEIRRLTDDARSLDDLMRLLWTRYGQVGEGVPEDGVEAAASEVAGHDLTAFFDAWIRGTADQDLDPLLARYGVRMHQRAADAPDDKGGRPSKLGDDKLAARGWAGLKAKAGGGGAELTSVQVGSPAAAAGLWAGDVVIAVDGLKVGGDLEKRLAALAPGRAMPVHAFRRDELFQTELRLAAPPVDTVWFERLADVDAETAARRDAWLGVGRVA